MTTNATHMSFFCSDLKQSKSFYNIFFGMEPTKEKDDYLKYELSNPNLVISFLLNPEKVSSNFGHLGIRVADEKELQSRWNKAKEAGIVSLEEKAVNCCYAIQDKFWVKDPDGIPWEVYFFHKDSDWEAPAENEGSRKCCSGPIS